VHPVIYMRRTAVEDYTIRGVTIKKGTSWRCGTCPATAMRRMGRPVHLQRDAAGPRHLSFGYGQHLCIGWRLAELQLGVVLEELLARYPDIAVTGPVTRMQTNFLNSIKTMSVRYTSDRRRREPQFLWERPPGRDS
jgi:linalool 8-monooxygenase